MHGYLVVMVRDDATRRPIPSRLSLEGAHHRSYRQTHKQKQNIVA